MVARYSDENRTSIRVTSGAGERCIPVDTRNADYLLLLSSGVEILDPLPPPIAVPQSVTPYQAQCALLEVGLLDEVEAVVALAPRNVQIAWTRGISVERHSPFIEALASGLGLSDEDIDQLFIAAGKI